VTVLSHHPYHLEARPQGNQQLKKNTKKNKIIEQQTSIPKRGAKKQLPVSTPLSARA
jgi:hypothetical protein